MMASLPCQRRLAPWAACSSRSRAGAPLRSLRTCAVAVPAAAGNSTKTVDVVALSNLCVDVVVPVAQLPPQDVEQRKQLLTKLTAGPGAQPTKDWELGGNCNFILAAARLGLRVGAVGHVGKDAAGFFLEDVFKEERVVGLERIAPTASESPSQASTSSSGDGLDKTLLCFVLVDPQSRHAFCSSYDFGPWPLLRGIQSLPDNALSLLRTARAVFVNGFVFDELPLEVVCGACREAIKHGAAVFFDPGPRCFTMKEGSRREALEAVLDLSDVVLMTEEEAAIVTGEASAEAAAKAVLSRPGAKTEWCVVKQGGEGALLACKSSGAVHHAPGMKVEVQDTVGCGDSFASAVVLGYVNQYAPLSTLALANAVGAATATGRGAGRNVAKADTVMRLLQQAASEHEAEQKAHVSEAINILQTSLDGGL